MAAAQPGAAQAPVLQKANAVHQQLAQVPSTSAASITGVTFAQAPMTNHAMRAWSLPGPTVSQMLYPMQGIGMPVIVPAQQAVTLNTALSAMAP